MLRYHFCLLAFFQAVLAQGEPLESFEELVEALRAGHYVSGNFHTGECEESNTPESVVASLRLDRWQYVEAELQVPNVIAVQSYVTLNGTVMVAFSYVDAEGLAVLESHEVSVETDLVINSYFASCTAGVGAFFAEKVNHQPDTAVASFDDLMMALVEGRPLTIVASATACGNSLEPQIIVAEGGSTNYRFYVVPDETGGTMIVVEWSGLSLSVVEGQTIYTVTWVNIYQDGSVVVHANYYNTITWEDEYPYPEGFQCVLGESINFYYASGDAYDTFLTSSEMDAALLAGKDMQVALDAPKCIAVEGTLPDYFYAGAKVVNWYRESFGTYTEFTFYQSFVNPAGDFVIQDIFTGSGNTVEVTIVTVNPLDSGDIKDVTMLQCIMGESIVFSAPAFNRTELIDYASVLEAELAGAKLTMVIVFEGCANPRGQFDLIDDSIGTNFQSLLVLSPDSVGERISLSTFLFTSSGGNRVNYNTLVMTIDERNNVYIFPGTWEYDENGEWGNSSDGLFIPCILGGGFKIFQEA